MSLTPEIVIEKTLAHLNSRNMRLNGQKIPEITPDKLRDFGSYCYIQPLAVYRDLCLHFLREHAGKNGVIAMYTFSGEPNPRESAARAERKIKSDQKYQDIYRQLCTELGIEPSLLPPSEKQQAVAEDSFTRDTTTNGAETSAPTPAYKRATQGTNATTTPRVIKQLNIFPRPLVNTVTPPADSLTSDFIREVAVCVHNQTYMGSRKKISVEDLESRNITKGRIKLIRPLAMFFEQKLLGSTPDAIGKEYSNRGIVSVQGALMAAVTRLRGNASGESFEMAYVMADFLELTDQQRVSLFLPPRNVLSMTEKVTAQPDSSAHLRP